MKLKQIGLVIGDFAVFYVSLYLTLTLRYLRIPQPEIWANNSQAFIAVFILWFLIFYVNNLYNLKIFAQKNKFLESFFESLAFAFVLSILYFYLFPDSDISPKTNLVIFTVTTAVLFLAWRYTFLFFIKNRLPKTNLGIIGYNNLMHELIGELHNNPQLGYEIKFIILENPDMNVALDAKHIPIFTSEDNLEELISKYKINNLIIEKGLHDSPDLQKKLFNCLSLGVNYLTLSNFYEKITGRVPLEIINEGWFLENLNLRDKLFYEFLKRLYDLLIGIILLVITIPFWPFIALAIRLNSRGPVFFKQIRLGKNNVPFTIYKFRTMVIANNDYSLTTKGDRRITEVGNFLRRTRLDELPQVINILKGQMSFIGPRPERLEFTYELEKTIPYYNIRTLVKPGVSGWDQVSGEYHSPTAKDTFQKLQHDLFYVKNRSIFLDLTITLKTIKTIVSFHGR
jgi:exopolysaccharide biosynthesis polyprenyl glycosylphosphotransferase